MKPSVIPSLFLICISMLYAGCLERADVQIDHQTASQDQSVNKISETFELRFRDVRLEPVGGNFGTNCVHIQQDTMIIIRGKASATWDTLDPFERFFLELAEVHYASQQYRQIKRSEYSTSSASIEFEDVENVWHAGRLTFILRNEENGVSAGTANMTIELELPNPDQPNFRPSACAWG